MKYLDQTVMGFFMGIGLILAFMLMRLVMGQALGLGNYLP